MEKYLFISWYGIKTSTAFGEFPFDPLIFTNAEAWEVFEEQDEQGDVIQIDFFEEDFKAVVRREEYFFITGFIFKELKKKNVSGLHLVFPEDYVDEFLDFLNESSVPVDSDEGEEGDVSEEDSQCEDPIFYTICADKAPLPEMDYHFGPVKKHPERPPDVMAFIIQELEEGERDDEEYFPT